MTDLTDDEPRPSTLPMAALAAFTLGLAPFAPEPHIVEKLRWIFVEGGVGMSPVDAFDVVLHGAPWVWLAVELVRWARGRTGQAAEAVAE